MKFKCVVCQTELDTNDGRYTEPFPEYNEYEVECPKCTAIYRFKDKS